MPKRNMSREKRSGTISSPAAMNITCSISCASVRPSSRSWMQSPSTAAASSGNIVDATSVIRADDGKEYEVLGMGPIAVLPKYQRRGIGRRIICMRRPSRSVSCKGVPLSGLKGRYVEAAVYHMDEKRAAEFDRHFPVKKKLSGIASQKRFRQIAAMRKKPDTARCPRKFRTFRRA